MAKRKTITFYTQREIDVIERVVKNQWYMIKRE